jgi:hypothetical protein
MKGTVEKKSAENCFEVNLYAKVNRRIIIPNRGVPNFRNVDCLVVRQINPYLKKLTFLKQDLQLMDFFTFEVGADRLSRNSGTELPLYSA